MNTYTLTVTENQLSLSRDATELLSRVSTGQVYKALSQRFMCKAAAAVAKAGGVHQQTNPHRAR